MKHNSAPGAAPAAQTLLGEVWMAFGTLDDGRLVALPEYAAVSEREVGSKVMDSARREGFGGLLAERLKALDWTIRRVVLAASPVAADTQGDAQDAARYRWIPVTERLPEGADAISCEAWCSAEEPGEVAGPCIMGFDPDADEDDQWQVREDTGCWEPGLVTHWRSRPEAPAAMKEQPSDGAALGGKS